MELKDAKVGMSVTCVDVEFSSLRTNQAYVIERVSGGFIYVQGMFGGFFPTRFSPSVVASPAPTGQAGGLKYDGGKAQWSLLMSTKGMLAAIKGVLGVLTFGAKKYAAHSWREVEDNERRYSDALVRHFIAIQEQGITAVDEESGLLHIDHLNCNGLFLAELARK